MLNSITCRSATPNFIRISQEICRVQEDSSAPLKWSMDINEMIFTEFALARHTSVKNVLCAQDRTEMHHANCLEFWGSECNLK